MEEATLHSFLAGKPALKERVVGFALRHVQCEPRYRAAFRQNVARGCHCQRCRRCPGLLAWLTPLKSLSSADLPFEKVVTLQGKCCIATGWLTGGSRKDGESAGLLAHERELRELPQQLDEHVALIDQLNSRISEVQRSQEGRRAEQAAMDKELQKMAAASMNSTKS